MRLAKELRGLLHSGTVRHADFHDPALRGRGVVAPDGSHAVWVVDTVTNLRDVLTERLVPLGLDVDRTYRVRLREDAGAAKWGWNTPEWVKAARTDAGFEVSGRLLLGVGLQVPPLWPMQALVLEFTAE
ncbi:MAG: GH36 C-terminal domain-containing protein [Bifidobacterium sp.]|nr:GH36 C-terminal domain-containing protein [Bifidobacterium sp.]